MRVVAGVVGGAKYHDVVGIALGAYGGRLTCWACVDSCDVELLPWENTELWDGAGIFSLLCIRHNSQEITELNQLPCGYVRLDGHDK
jgi:hypothetical protein